MNASEKQQAYRYDAFISYSRQDEAFAKWLENKLESYRFPRGTGGKRRFNIFRDVQDLIGNDLPSGIQNALRSSRHLVVLCSPASRSSVWVRKEIETFASVHGPEYVIPVLVDGRPNHEVAPVDEVQDQAFPEALYALFEEPLAADFRVFEGERFPRRRARQREALFQILAFLLGVEKEDLLRRQRKRTARRIGTVLAVVLAAMVAFAWIAGEARNERAAAEEAQKKSTARNLVLQARMLFGQEPDLALLISSYAYQAYDDMETRSNLLAALQQDARLRTFLHGHAGSISSVTFSPDGKKLASGSRDSTVRIWDVETQRLLVPPLRGHRAPVLNVAFSPDGKRLVSVSDSTVWLWDIETQRSLASSPTGHPEQIMSTAFSPDGKRLAVAGRFFITLWDLQAWRQLGKPFQDDQVIITSLIFTPDSKQLLSTDISGRIMLWDVETQQLLAPVRDVDQSDVTAAALSPDGKHMALGAVGIWLWNLRAGRSVGSTLRGHSSNVGAIAFTPDGKRLASGSYDGTVRLWDVETQQPIDPPLRGHRGGVNTVAVSPDGTRLASGGTGTSIILWDIDAQHRLARPLRGHEELVRSVAFSPEGRRLVSADDDGIVRFWNTEMWQPHGPVIQTDQTQFNVKFSPDGKRVALVGLNLITLWNAATGEILGTMRHEAHEKQHLPSLAFSPAGTLLASGGMDAAVWLWDLESEQPVGHALYGHESTVLSIAFSPDGRRLASGEGHGPIRLWDVEKQQPLGKPLRGHEEAVLGVAFSGPMGKQLLSIDWSGRLLFWDLEARNPVGLPLYNFQDDIQSVAFSPDGKRLALLCTTPGDVAKDGYIRLWEVETQQVLQEPLRFPAFSYALPSWGSLGFSPDGKLLASGLAHNTVLIWNVDPAFWEEQACRTANRNLTQAEWDRYIGHEIPYECVCPDLPAGEAAAVNAAECTPYR